MIHDPELLDLIQTLPCSEFEGQVFRTTGLNADPTAFSTNGGRWAPPDGADGSCPILYTSLESDGALAEVASYLSLLTPVPKKPLALHTLEVAPKKTLRIAIDNFDLLGLDHATYAQRNYERTQTIGAAANFLELDGLLAPSARWECDNLMIFGDNYPLDDKLKTIATRDVGYDEWSRVSDYQRLFHRA